jgi:hypothetical protein
MKMNEMTRDDILGYLGLQSRNSPAKTALEAVGLFGAGLLVGAGIALLIAPKPGRDLRDELTRRLKKPTDDDRGAAFGGATEYGS